MDINNKYTTEIELVEMKILIFESEYKKAKNENIVIRNYIEDLIFANKIYITNLIYNSYELEIKKVYNTIDILLYVDDKLCKEFNTKSNQIYSNKDNFNLCEKLTEDLNENIKKSHQNNDKIDDYKNIINELRKEREVELLKWKQ